MKRPYPLSSTRMRLPTSSIKVRDVIDEVRSVTREVQNLIDGVRNVMREVS